MMKNDRIASACPDAILAIDHDGRIADLNDAARAMFGWPGDTLIGRSVNVLLPSGQRGCRSEWGRASGQPGRSARNSAGDWRVVEAQRREGTRFPVNVWLTAEKAQGRWQAIAFVRDMSPLAASDNKATVEKAELEDKRERNALLASVAEKTSDSVIITDADGLTLWVNPATETLTGYEASEFVGRKPGDLLQGPDADSAAVEKLSRAIEDGRATRCELLNHTKTGESYWIEMNVTPIRDAAGRLDKFIAVIRDITIKKAQENALAEAKRGAERAEGRLASAIEAMSEGFVIYDEHDRLVMVNSAYKKMRAEDADIIVPGVKFEKLVRTAVERGHFDTEGEDPEAWVRKQVAAREQGGDVETMVKFTDGRWMLRRERRTPQGEMIGIRSDITNFKAQEAALQEARTKAEAADRAKSEFVANISHELRTPINAITGFNQLMLGDDLNEKQRERAEIVRTSSEHLLQLVNDLLDLSRIASNSVELEPTRFEVAELIRDSIETMTPMAKSKGLKLTASLNLPPGAAIDGDRSRIKQILLNLISNAVNYTDEGRVCLRARSANGGIAFEVADTGEGMPQDKLQAIFERFARIKGPNSSAGGAGLGLAITKGLVDLMGGKVEVSSQLGEGSTFTVYLPLCVTGSSARAEKPAGRKKKAAGKRRDRMYDVLVAEDHPFNQILISEILDSIGCSVTIAENGQEALEQIDEEDFDLIIMDNQMPVMNGLEAIGRIRARDDWKTRIPIIALTANAMRGAEKDYRQHGVEAFMTKPLDMNDVIETVKRLGSAGRKLRKEAHSDPV